MSKSFCYLTLTRLITDITDKIKYFIIIIIIVQSLITVYKI